MFSLSLKKGKEKKKSTFSFCVLHCNGFLPEKSLYDTGQRDLFPHSNYSCTWLSSINIFRYKNFCKLGGIA